MQLLFQAGGVVVPVWHFWQTWSNAYYICKISIKHLFLIPTSFPLADGLPPHSGDGFDNLGELQEWGHCEETGW